MTMAGSERQESVEILRGIAAFSVMWFHLVNGNASFPAGDGWLRASGAYGYLGVQLFFVISGFVIPYSLARRNYRIAADGLGFLGRRLVRIEPAYLVSVALMVVLQVASALTPGSGAAMPASELAASMVLHVAYLAPWFHVPWLSPVYWSLAIELQYYVVMLFAAPLLLSKRRTCVSLVLLAAAILPLLIDDERLLLRYLPLFGLGFIRFLAFRRVLTVAELAGWAALYFGLYWFVFDRHQALAAAFAFFFLFLPLKRPLPVLSFLGSISYSLYLVHFPIGGRIINLAARLPPTLVVQLAGVLLAAAGIDLCGLLLLASYREADERFLPVDRCKARRYHICPGRADRVTSRIGVVRVPRARA